MDTRTYWDSIHEENSAGDVSWYQATPVMSLGHIEKVGPALDARVLDVGCGQAGIAAALVDRGYRRVSALDIAPEAIRRAKERLGPKAAEVDWIEQDVLDFAAEEPFDLWHDRAVLHFFTNDRDQRRYADAVRRNLAEGGHAIIATFAPDGPEKCSGLPVQRHDAESMRRLLQPEFELLGSSREMHATPWNTLQAFEWALFARIDGSRAGGRST